MSTPSIRMIALIGPQNPNCSSRIYVQSKYLSSYADVERLPSIGYEGTRVLKARTEKASLPARTSAIFLPFLNRLLRSLHRVLGLIVRIHNRNVSVENTHRQEPSFFFSFRLTHQQRRLLKLTLDLTLPIHDLQSNDRPRCARLPRRWRSPRSLSTPSPSRSKPRHPRLSLSRRISPLGPSRRALRNPLARLERRSAIRNWRHLSLCANNRRCVWGGGRV